MIAGEPLPCAIVDLDALEANVAALAAPLRNSGKTLRVATKSLRCPISFAASSTRPGPSRAA